MKQRIVLYATEGMVLTDGEHYGKIIFLADNILPDAYYEITEEEYQKIIEKQVQIDGLQVE